MADLPTFSDASETAQDAADAARHHGRQLIPWLDTPPACDDCGAMLYASESFDPRQAAYVKSWECRECDAVDRYRDPEHGGEFAEGPSEGSAVVRAWLRNE